MSEQTNIEWCDSTFNPWTGCTKVSPGCDNCYAEGWAKRSGIVQWGAQAERRRTSPANWKKPMHWEREHEAFFILHGRRRRVFCASLADVFDNRVPASWRADLFQLIERTPHLDWLLVTKRIGNVESMMLEVARHHQIHNLETQMLPSNVWLGITVVNQQEADRDIPKLLDTRASVRFLSMEPLLGPVDLTSLEPKIFAAKANALTGRWKWEGGPTRTETGRLDWVIVGGESGHGARPMHPDWARDIRDQCAAAGVPFLFKQWGEWGHYVNEEHYTHCGEERRAHAWVDSLTGAHGKCWVVDDDGTWSNHTGEPPQGNEDGSVASTVAVMGWHGKKAAGRQLDGRTWDGFPHEQSH
ncbi:MULTISPECIES: phage Gp37/Gp68 family protein [Caballeronia]|uniref:phage Gp37/Gp68 family protein n=1 Tax=Caballeronia TaxID=1827195 RepID=UPI001FD5EF7E|nr:MULTISPECIES: phage Gp37/Gp68 family protein [Caballeronia]MDR5798938.1 phage Gp37/Gp68 family protein [Caballeronia sp. LZ001]